MCIGGKIGVNTFHAKENFAFPLLYYGKFIKYKLSICPSLRHKFWTLAPSLEVRPMHTYDEISYHTSNTSYNNSLLNGVNNRRFGSTNNHNNHNSFSEGVKVRVMTGVDSMRICGPKLSTCCVLLSLWGIVQLLIMGAAFSSRSVALVEDIYINETIKYKSEAKLLDAMDESYSKSATNCYIAAALYCVTLVVALHQRWLNNRRAGGNYQRYS